MKWPGCLRKVFPLRTSLPICYPREAAASGAQPSRARSSFNEGPVLARDLRVRRKAPDSDPFGHRFLALHGPRDDRFEHLRAKEAADLLLDLAVESCPPVDHHHDDSEDVEALVQVLFCFLDRLQEIVYREQAVDCGRDRDHEVFRGYEAIERKNPKRGRGIDENEVVAVDLFEDLLESEEARGVEEDFRGNTRELVPCRKNREVFLVQSRYAFGGLGFIREKKLLDSFVVLEGLLLR